MSYQGLFTGLTTLDFVYLIDRLPCPNQKLVAADSTIAAGGPATNAAVCFQHLGGCAQLLSGLGCHPTSEIARSDLRDCGVQLEDLDAQRQELPPVSSILVTATTGERAVVSINATKSQVPGSALPEAALDGVDVVLIDGHQMDLGEAIARRAQAQQIPLVIDGGSWKLGFDRVLPYVDYAICSANFMPPGCTREAEVFEYLKRWDIPHIAVTHGASEIVYQTPDGDGAIEVPPVDAVDTLGAGDFFHGAFCYYILERSFPEALTAAAEVASCACQSFGTRTWMRRDVFGN